MEEAIRKSGEVVERWMKNTTADGVRGQEAGGKRRTLKTLKEGKETEREGGGAEERGGGGGRWIKSC